MIMSADVDERLLVEMIGVRASRATEAQRECVRLQVFGSGRGRGLSTLQISSAPRGAIYVWCTDELTYARELLLRSGRSDLRLHRVSVLCGSSFQLRGLEVPIIVDHALVENRDTTEGLQMVRDHNWRLASRR